MPLGNGAPGGLASMPLGVYSDVRAYNTVHGSAGDTGFDPITKPSLYSLSPYKKVVLSTPGLGMFWPLGQFKTIPGGTSGFLNAFGCTSLRTQGAGTVTIAAGLIPGDRNPSVKLAGGSYLDGVDYFVWPMGEEAMMTVEFWINFDSLLADTGLVADWGSSNGWMVYSNSGDLRMYCGSNNIATSGTVFSASQTYHVVCCFGGSQPPTADYVSRAYVNGVQVLSANLTQGTGLAYTGSTGARAQVGQYANGGGTNALHGRIQDVAIYNRMLQPLEVKQHYAAGFARA